MTVQLLVVCIQAPIMLANHDFLVLDTPDQLARCEESADEGNDGRKPR